MRVMNLTKHDISIKAFGPANPTEKLLLKFNPSGEEARVEMEYSDAEYKLVDVPLTQLGFQTIKAKVGKVIGLPEPQEDTYYIVSAMVAQAVPERTDVYAPDTGDTAIRDKKGNIVQVTRLVQYSNPRIEELKEDIKDLQSHLDLRNKIEWNKKKREKESERFDEISHESERREIEELRDKNFDLQDELDNKDHQWGTSRR